MIIKLYPENPAQRHLNTIYECLMDGGVIIYPTDTIYAFGCHPCKGKAVERIAQLKGIKKKEADFSFIFSDLSQLSTFTKSFDKSIFKVMKRNLPGPFTFILEANSNIPKIFNNKKKTIGIRIPDHNVALSIINQLDYPLISSSIHAQDNILEYNTDPEILHDEFSDKVDIVVDGGFGDNQVSTIVDCVDGDFEIIREGKGILQF